MVYVVELPANYSQLHFRCFAPLDTPVPQFRTYSFANSRSEGGGGRVGKGAVNSNCHRGEQKLSQPFFAAGGLAVWLLLFLSFLLYVQHGFLGLNEYNPVAAGSRLCTVFLAPATSRNAARKLSSIDTVCYVHSIGYHPDQNAYTPPPPPGA